MIIDASAIVAILRGEPEARVLAERAIQAETLRLSAGGWIELAAVTSSDDPDVLDALDALLRELRVSIEPVTVEQARIGFRAYREFGKGHHRARLNFGDCFAYALAIATGEPLLFKGDDFTHTDVRKAI